MVEEINEVGIEAPTALLVHRDHTYEQEIAPASAPQAPPVGQRPVQSGVSHDNGGGWHAWVKAEAIASILQQVCGVLEAISEALKRHKAGAHLDAERHPREDGSHAGGSWCPWVRVTEGMG